MISAGIIDTFGFVAIVEALDMCLKTADVHFVRMEKMSGGIVSIVIKGDVAAVTSGIASGVEAAKRLGGYRRHTIIARVDHQTEELLYRGKLIRENVELKKSAAKDIAVQSSETPEGPAVSDPVEESKLVSMELHEEALVAMSVPELRRLARQINIKTMDKDTIKRARKADLIMNILSGYKEREE